MNRFSQALGKVPTIVIDEPGRSDWEIKFDDKGILCMIIAKGFKVYVTEQIIAEALMHLDKDQLKTIYRHIFHREYTP